MKKKFKIELDGTIPAEKDEEIIKKLKVLRNIAKKRMKKSLRR